MKIQDAIRKLDQLKRALQSADILSSVGDMAVKAIYNNTKSGYGVQKSGDSFKPEKLKSLSSKYIEYRKKYIAKGKLLGKFGSAARSNLTLTGQMLENLKSKVFKTKVSIFIDNTSRSDSSSNNQEIAEFVSDKRPFLGITDNDLNIIRNEVIKKIEKIIKELF